MNAAAVTETTLPQIIGLDRWEQFPAAVKTAISVRDTSTPSTPPAPQFRGVADSRWGLETTLERSFPHERSSNSRSFKEYFGKAGGAKFAIESQTGSRWDGIPNPPELNRILAEPGWDWLHMALNQRPAIYEYLVYLRHHAFPSPLLDWTTSPFVAAYFAFDNATGKDGRSVGVHLLLKDTILGGSSDHDLFFVGPYMRTDPRHYKQQAWYSICVAQEGTSSERDYIFQPHADGLQDALGPKGKWLEFTLPSTERKAALKDLDQMNINAYTLFRTEDALVRTAARRELLFSS